MRLIILPNIKIQSTKWTFFILSSKMEQLKEKLEEIAKVPSIEGATLLTITSLIQYKIEQAIKIIDG